MRGIAPIPSTRSCILHGDHARIAFPTSHLRAYRYGTAGSLLHLVAQGERHTRCSLAGIKRRQNAPFHRYSFLFGTAVWERGILARQEMPIRSNHHRE
jgi:hypothetical protein